MIYLSRPVDHIQVVSINADIITQFFAQVSVRFFSKGVKSEDQVVNLNETEFTPGWDINCTDCELVVIVAAHRATRPMLASGTKIAHRSFQPY